MLIVLAIWPYLSMPVDSAPSQLLYDGLLTFSAACLAGAARRRRGRASAPIWAFFAANVIYLLGDLAWYAIFYIVGEPPQSASVADVGYAGYYLVLVAALILLQRARRPGRDLGALLDGLILAVSLSMLILVYLVIPIASSTAFSWIGWAVSVSYPVLDVIVLFMVTSLLTAPGSRPFSLVLLFVAMGVLLAADTWYGFRLAEGTFVAGGILDLSWPLVFALIAAAFLHPSADVMLVPTDRKGTGKRSAVRFIVLAAALLAPALVAALASTPVQQAVALASALIVFVLVVARIWQLAGSLDHTRRRFAALVQNAEDLILVITADGTVIYQSPSALATLGRLGNLRSMLHPDSWAPFDAATRGPTEARQARVVDLRVVLSDDQQRHYSTVITNLTHDRDVHGLVLNLRDVTERARLEEQLRYQAMHDQLTDLPNRRLFADRVNHALAASSREASHVAVMVMDLDGFKEINDLHGHATGDQFLRDVARAMKECVRAGDTVARLGGDEFGVLLPAVSSWEEALNTANRLRERLASTNITCSVGVAIADEHADVESLTRMADHAMYEAKHSGRDRTVVSGGPSVD